MYSQTDSNEIKIINKDSGYYEILNVSKTNNTLKNGLYQKYFNTKIGISGQYSMNSKVGIWKYYDWDGKEYLKFDYTNNQIVSFISDTIRRKIILKKDTIIGHVDRPALYFGSRMEVDNFVRHHMNYPNTALEKYIEGKVIIGIVINDKGIAENYYLARGVEQSLNKEALRVVMDFKGKWIPAIYNGKTVKSVYFQAVYFTLQ